MNPNPDNYRTLEACQRLQAGGIMTDEDKKLLTEFLDECWHEFINDGRCDICGAVMGNPRTFDTWQDLGDLKEKLVEKGKYEGEYGLARFAHDKWYTQFHTIFKSYDGWLLSPAVFIPLVVEFLRKENV